MSLVVHARHLLAACAPRAARSPLGVLTLLAVLAGLLATTGCAAPNGPEAMASRYAEFSAEATGTWSLRDVDPEVPSYEPAPDAEEIVTLSFERNKDPRVALGRVRVSEPGRTEVYTVVEATAWDVEPDPRSTLSDAPLMLLCASENDAAVLLIGLVRAGTLQRLFLTRVRGADEDEPLVYERERPL